MSVSRFYLWKSDFFLCSLWNNHKQPMGKIYLISILREYVKHLEYARSYMGGHPPCQPGRPAGPTRPAEPVRALMDNGMRAEELTKIKLISN